jgi:glucose-6-phosphate dehydrogenase assembly protein OpcA
VHPTAGLLTAGWLASRLGWRAASVEQGGTPGRGRVTYDTPGGRQVTVELRSAIGSAALNSVRLLVDGDGQPVTVLLEARGRLLLASRSGGHELAGTRVGHCVVSKAQNLGGELELFGRDQVFEQALAATAPWTDGHP